MDNDTTALTFPAPYPDPMDFRVVVAAALVSLLAVGAGCVENGPEQLANMDLSRGSIGTVDGPCPGLCTFDFVLESQPWTEVLATWNGSQTAGFKGELLGPNGTNWTLQRGFDAVRVVLDDAPAGAYQLILEGKGNLTTRVGPLVTEPGQILLPNVVTMIPAQIGFGPCDSVEQDEQGAKRCLRLGNGVGNAGHGPLEVALSAAEGALTLAGEAVDLIQGSFVQHIYNADGTYTARPVGAADFHRSHGHFHYDSFARFRLYPVEDGLRGEVAAAGHKSGFCLLDWGRMQEPEVPRESGGRADQACLLPNAKGWSMGVSAGWFDFYWSDLTDQYIEASGVEDGVYELVSIADPDGWLEESNEADNAASALIRIEGDVVEVLEERGFYRMPPDTARL